MVEERRHLYVVLFLSSLLGVERYESKGQVKADMKAVVDTNVVLDAQMTSHRNPELRGACCISPKLHDLANCKKPESHVT